MLTRAQEKQIKSLHSKKGRRETGLCLVEGPKLIEAAGKQVAFTFTQEDTPRFDSLVTTKTPQNMAAVARIPLFSIGQILEQQTVVILDRVQDPGNVGAIFRLCQAFEASLILHESADPASPKVIRSSAGSMFHVPWTSVTEAELLELMREHVRPVFRLEKTDQSAPVTSLRIEESIFLVAGSEGSGISLPVEGTSIAIQHHPSLESLNVGNAVAISLYERGSLS